MLSFSRPLKFPILDCSICHKKLTKTSWFAVLFNKLENCSGRIDDLLKNHGQAVICEDCFKKKFGNP